MKKALFTIVLAILSIVYVNAQTLSLQEILKKHFEAVGQEKLAKVTTVKMTGKMQMQGMEFPFSVYLKRPDKVRVEANIQGSTMIQAYNGKVGYMIAPWTGSSDPQDVNEDQLKDFKDQADIDGKLFDYVKKGSTLELIGNEDMEGTKVYKLKLTEKAVKEGVDPDISYFFIDAENFVILKITSKRNMGGNVMEVDSYTSNYKQVDGIAMPYSSESKVQGNSVNQITVDKITFNEDMADGLFEKPVK
jgi:outer membrane lipoprotein-sorting protein